jgi:hypothetical protein
MSYKKGIFIKVLVVLAALAMLASAVAPAFMAF